VTSSLLSVIISWNSGLACLLGLILLPMSGIAQEKVAASIPDSEIEALQSEMADGVRGATSVDVRRACKGVIRKAEALIAADGEAPNRYEALAVMFDCQKRVLTLETTEENRSAIFATCEKLAIAPDEYAELRLEADMLLSERDLALKQATTDERVQALELMLAKYRGTQAEWKSLMMGSLVAVNLQEFDVDKGIRDTMFERFAGDHKAIEFRRKSNPGGETDVVFSGTFKTASGSLLVFPYDFLGHQYVVCFWSEAMPELDKSLAAFKAVQDSLPGRFRDFSLNLDELPDAGEKILRKMKLDWTALHLPGGSGSSAFQAYATSAPLAVLVNGQGHALLRPPPAKQEIGGVVGIGQGLNLPDIVQTLDSERYLAQLRSLFIGDFLVAETGVAKQQRPATSTEPPASEQGDVVPTATLQTIQECFVAPPLRYRLPRKQELDNYVKAENLCASAIKKYSKAPELWVVRNRRMIALIGMWNGAGEPKHLEEAVKEAKTVLAMDLPAGADVAARFCLAKEALRNGNIDPEVLLAGLITESGGENAPASALAAAAILALESNARTSHEQYRQKLLALEESEHPYLWQVYAFLRDRHHCYRNFWASPGGYGFDRPQKYKFRDIVAGLEEPQDRNRRIQFELRTLDGGVLKIPEYAAGAMLGVVFAEPPVDLSARSNLVDQVNGFGRTYTSRGVKAVVTFLSDDTNTARSMITGLDSELQVGILPGGLGNPLVQQLGILSADRMPNPLLFRPDGTVAWTISGLEYRHYGSGVGYAMTLGIGSNIEKIKSDTAFEVLQKGDFTNALAIFQNFAPADSRSDWWAADRFQGRALAYMGIKDWNAALGEIDKAIERRRDDFKSAMCKCHGIVEMHLTKAAILEKLGREQEARIERSRASKERLPHSKLPPGEARGGVPVGVYYEQLKQVRLELEGK